MDKKKKEKKRINFGKTIHQPRIMTEFRKKDLENKINKFKDKHPKRYAFAKSKGWV
tara:strand:- start:1361 stop:1528 length:168 start_codon:yes stop_codon:yes gene_type:complete